MEPAPVRGLTRRLQSICTSNSSYMIGPNERDNLEVSIYVYITFMLHNRLHIPSHISHHKLWMINFLLLTTTHKKTMATTSRKIFFKVHTLYYHFFFTCTCPGEIALSFESSKKHFTYGETVMQKKKLKNINNS